MGVRTTHAWRLGGFNPACHSGWLLYDNTKGLSIGGVCFFAIALRNTGTGLSQEYSVMGPTPAHHRNKQTNKTRYKCSMSLTQDYRLWASWSPYDGPKSFLLGRAESISLQRTWSPCTVNGPSSSHCKGPEVHPTLMDLGPSCWEGLSPPHIDGPKRAMHSQGSIPLQRTEFISTQWTW